MLRSRTFLMFFRMFVLALGFAGLAGSSLLPTAQAASPQQVFATTPYTAPDVLTHHNDNPRSGQILNETILNTSNVNGTTFGKLFNRPLDGFAYVQPLYVSNVVLPDTSIHNIVYVATEHDSVYAFDADQKNATTPLWCRSFISTPTAGCTSSVGSNITPVPYNDVYPGVYKDIWVETGITATPVIDRTTNTIYVVAMTKEAGPTYFYKLHALDITTGAEKLGGPVTISGSVACVINNPGQGDCIGGFDTFTPLLENARAALGLANGQLYVMFAAFADKDPYHGWIMSYNATTLAQTGIFNTSPDGPDPSDSYSSGRGGIWMSGGGPGIDSAGNFFAITGNGTFDLNTGGRQGSSSVLKLGPPSAGTMPFLDYFTPFNQVCLDGRDADFGSASPILLPDQAGAHPHEVLALGKEGRIYVIDRDNLGHFVNDPAITGYPCAGSEEAKHLDNVVQEIDDSNVGPFFGSFAFWKDSTNTQYIYVGSASVHPLVAYKLVNGLLVTPASSKTTDNLYWPGSTPSISSNGNTAGSGIVWIIAPPITCPTQGSPTPGDTATPDNAHPFGCTPVGPGILRAYDATNLATKLFDSGTMNTAVNAPSNDYVKFSVPTIAGGKVFMGASTASSSNKAVLLGSSLEVYGLLDASLAAAPSPVSFTYPSSGSTLPQAVELTATHGAINWTDSIDYGVGPSGWLTLGATGGTVLPDLPGSLNLSVDQTVAGSLAPGIYTATLHLANTVAATNGANPDQTVTVTLQVTASQSPMTVTVDDLTNQVANGYSDSYQIAFANVSGTVTTTSATITVRVPPTAIYQSCAIAAPHTGTCSYNVGTRKVQYLLTGGIVPGDSGMVTLGLQIDGPIGAAVVTGATLSYTDSSSTVYPNATDSDNDTIAANTAPLATHVSYVDAALANGTLNVSWATARESRNLGFLISAVNAQGHETTLTAHLVPAHSTIGQADGLYSTALTAPVDTTGIVITDVEPGGVRLRHGPYTLGARFGTLPTYGSAPAHAQPAGQPFPTTPIVLRKADAALSIAQDGIYHLDYAALLAQGIDLTGSTPASLALSAGKADVPLYVQTAKAKTFGPGDYIEFKASAHPDTYNSASVYVLTARPAKQPRHLSQPPSVIDQPPPGGPPSVATTRTLPGQRYYWQDAPATTDAWTWALLENDIPQLASQSVSFDLPDLYNTGASGDSPATVTLHLRGWGGYAHTSPDHHAIASINGGGQSDVRFDQDQTATLHMTVPASALQKTGNTLNLRAPGDMGVQYDTMILESIDVQYPKTTALPESLTHVAGVRSFTRAASLTQNIVAQAKGSRLDYLIISHPDFMADAASLAAFHRKHDGLHTAVVDVNAIYDSYSNGQIDPAAIQRFIAAMVRQHHTRYVVLVGADSIDPRDFLKQGDRSFIPAYHVLDSYGTRGPTDAPYADTNGDGLPDVALGRLPVQSGTELSALVAKITTFAAGSSAQPTATFVTDPTDTAFVPMTQTDIAALPKKAHTQQISWQAGNAQPATTALLTQWQQGSRIISYTGHSNANVWADDGVFDARSLARLQQSKAALVTVWGCWAANYDSTFGGTGVSQALLAMPNGGAASIVASTTELPVDENGALSAAFFAALYDKGKPQPIGQALLQAKRTILAAHPTWRDAANGLLLLGDPALMG